MFYPSLEHGQRFLPPDSGGNVSAHATHLVGSALSDPYYASQQRFPTRPQLGVWVVWVSFTPFMISETFKMELIFYGHILGNSSSRVQIILLRVERSNWRVWSMLPLETLKLCRAKCDRFPLHCMVLHNVNFHEETICFSWDTWYVSHKYLYNE